MRSQVPLVSVSALDLSIPLFLCISQINNMFDCDRSDELFSLSMIEYLTCYVPILINGDVPIYLVSGTIPRFLRYPAG